MTKVKKSKHLPYCPRFSGSPFEGRAFNLVKRVYPRLAAAWEFDDLLQEAALVFLTCRERYLRQAREGGKVVDNPAWFMALYSRALHNRFIDLQRSLRPYISIDGIDEDDLPATEIDLGFCWRLFCELPADVRQLLTLLGEGDDSVLPALNSHVMKET